MHLICYTHSLVSSDSKHAAMPLFGSIMPYILPYDTGEPVIAIRAGETHFQVQFFISIYNLFMFEMSTYFELFERI